MSARSKISKNFKPKLSDVEIKATFPLLDPNRTLLAFVAYHLEKDDTSANWDATFYGWCDYRQRQAEQLQSTEKVTDSMGFKVTKGGSALPVGESDYGSRFLAAYNRYLAEGMDHDGAAAAAEREAER